MSNLNKPHRNFSQEFKLSIVKSYLSGKKTALQLAAKYDIGDRLVRSWATQFKTGGKEALAFRRGAHNNKSGRPPKIKFGSELEQLRHENLQLKGELFLLKKLKELREKKKE